MPALTKFLPSWNAASTLLLRLLFIAVLVGRLLYPFFQNPVDSVSIDMARHLMNGNSIFHPTFVNAMDPKFYQLWLHVLELFPESQQRSFYALANGLLCAGMMWFWYKALREITTRRKALILSIIIGVHLSFLVIYQYFLIETMVLTTVAASAWLTLRAARKHTLASFFAASLCWTIAAFTKQTVLPVMVLGIGYALFGQPQKFKAICITAAVFTLFLIPASWQGYKVLHFFAPFGYEDIQTISRKCECTTFALHVTDFYSYNDYLFFPEAFYFNPLHPFGTYATHRANIPYVVSVDLTRGRTDWDEAMKLLSWNRTWKEMLSEYYENFLFLFFTYSYPDSTSPTPHTDPHLKDDFQLRVLNFHLRWTWPPCLLLVLLCGPFVRMTPGKTWILLVAFVMTWGFLLQDVGLVEGRYRKIIEPFLLLSTFFMIESRFGSKDEKNISMYGLTMSTLVIPLIRQLLAPVFPVGEAPQPIHADAPHEHEKSNV